MNSIWNNLYDQVKDRRYGLLFFYTFFAVIGMLLVVLTIQSNPSAEIYVAAGFLVVFAFAIRLRGRGQRDRSEGAPKFPPLSRDERNKARSKLKTGFKPPPVNLPDTDLKY